MHAHTDDSPQRRANCDQDRSATLEHRAASEAASKDQRKTHTTDTTHTSSSYASVLHREHDHTPRTHGLHHPPRSTPTASHPVSLSLSLSLSSDAQSHAHRHDTRSPFAHIENSVSEWGSLVQMTGQLWVPRSGCPAQMAAHCESLILHTHAHAQGCIGFDLARLRLIARCSLLSLVSVLAHRILTTLGSILFWGRTAPVAAQM